MNVVQRTQEEDSDDSLDSHKSLEKSLPNLKKAD